MTEGWDWPNPGFNSHKIRAERAITPVTIAAARRLLRRGESLEWTAEALGLDDPGRLDIALWRVIGGRTDDSPWR